MAQEMCHPIFVYIAWHTGFKPTFVTLSKRVPKVWSFNVTTVVQFRLFASLRVKITQPSLHTSFKPTFVTL